MPTNEVPQVIIVAGINGAGKSTAAPNLLKEFHSETYLDADEIARLLGDDPQRAAIRAGRVMHSRIEELRSARRSFALETTLSGLSLRRNLEQLHAAGYESFLLYLWLPSARLAVSRVSGRVRMGGHHIPTEDILRRYLRSVYNFESVFRHLVTEWRVYHGISSAWGEGGDVIARGDSAGAIDLYDARAWREIQAQAASHASRGGSDD
jgi:predicted ABC-type ATPase